MATVTTGLDAHGISRSEVATSEARNRRRHITPEAGRALEMLGHAIEYLTDEFVHEGKDLSARDPQVQAIQLLMALNRQVYYECPFVPTFGEKFRTIFRAIPRLGARL